MKSNRTSPEASTVHAVSIHTGGFWKSEVPYGETKGGGGYHRPKVSLNTIRIKQYNSILALSRKEGVHSNSKPGAMQVTYYGFCTQNATCLADSKAGHSL